MGAGKSQKGSPEPPLHSILPQVGALEPQKQRGHEITARSSSGLLPGTGSAAPRLAQGQSTCSRGGSRGLGGSQRYQCSRICIHVTKLMICALLSALSHLSWSCPGLSCCSSLRERGLCEEAREGGRRAGIRRSAQQQIGPAHVHECK
jgi:hypothetical protein